MLYFAAESEQVGLVWSDVITSIATVVLVIVTLLYTIRTGSIASSSASAANAAKDAADTALLQNVLAVQPRVVTVEPFAVTLRSARAILPEGPGLDQWAVDSIEGALINVGPGALFNPEIGIVLADSAQISSTPLKSIQSGEVTPFILKVDPSQQRRILEEGHRTFAVELRGSDALSFGITVRWESQIAQGAEFDRTKTRYNIGRDSSRVHRRVLDTWGPMLSSGSDANRNAGAGENR